MAKNCKLLVTIAAIGFFMGTHLLMGTFLDAQGKELPADVKKWLKENKIGPFQEDKVDYDALYKAAKKEGRVVVYSSTSRGPKSFALGFYKKYPGIKVEWNTIGTGESIKRVIAEQKAGISNVDIINASDPPTQWNVLAPANMIFPWVPPELRGAIPREWQDPLLVHRVTELTIFYNAHNIQKPPIDSWWDMTKPEWKGKIVAADPRTYVAGLNQFITIALNGDEMAKDYKRVFGKPIKLTTPNAGYEWIKMFFANEPKLVKKEYEARFAGKPSKAKTTLIVNMSLSRITDVGNPKYGGIKWYPLVNLKPRIGIIYPTFMNIAYKAPHPNAAKIVIRWLMGDEKGGAGFSPWFVPGYAPARTDVKTAPPHPFVPELTWSLKDLNFWFLDSEGVWKEKGKVLDFIYKQLK
jgi:iron(III) transport system substrate-binding protein